MLRKGSNIHESKMMGHTVHLKGVALSNADKDESLMLSGYINLEFHQNLKRLAHLRRTRRHSL